MASRQRGLLLGYDSGHVRAFVRTSAPPPGLAPVADDLPRAGVPPAGRRTERREVDHPVLDLGHLPPDTGPPLDGRLDDVARRGPKRFASRRAGLNRSVSTPRSQRPIRCSPTGSRAKRCSSRSHRSASVGLRPPGTGSVGRHRPLAGAFGNSRPCVNADGESA